MIRDACCVPRDPETWSRLAARFQQGREEPWTAVAHKRALSAGVRQVGREATEVKADWEESAAWSQILQVCDGRQFQLGEPCHAAGHWVSQQDCIDKSSRCCRGPELGASVGELEVGLGQVRCWLPSLRSVLVPVGARWGTWPRLSLTSSRRRRAPLALWKEGVASTRLPPGAQDALHAYYCPDILGLCSKPWGAPFGRSWHVDPSQALWSPLQSYEA